MPFAHRAEGNALWSFRDAENYASVLNREKTFRYVDVEKNGADERRKRNNECDGAKAEDEFQRTSVEGDDCVEHVFGFAIEPGFFFFFLMAKKFGAHHRRESKRNHPRDEDGDGESDGKFAE